MKSNLARKYRPKTLNDLIGQPVMVKVLSNAIKRDRLHQCYLFVGQFGCGKCVTGDTLIVTQDGLRYIEDVAYDDSLPSYAGFQEKEQFVHNALTDNWVLSSHSFSQLSQSTVYMNTSEGFNIEGTSEHPVLIFSKDSLRPEWKCLQDVQLNDYICVSRNKVSYGQHISEDLVYILAALTAEGHWDKKYFNFTNKNVRLVNRFVEAVKNEFGYECSVSKDKRTECQKAGICSVQISDKLKELGLSTELSGLKSIPSAILSSDLSNRKLFLVLYLEFDGHVAKGHSLEYYSKSEKLCKELQMLLLTTLGVISSRQPMFKSATNGKDIHRLYYRVTVYPTEFNKMRDAFDYQVPTELKFGRFLLTLEEKKLNPNTDLIPYLKSKFTQIKQKMPIANNGKLILNSKGVAKVASPPNCVLSNNSLTSYGKAEEILQYCKTILQAVEESNEVFLGQCGWYQELKLFADRCQDLLLSRHFFSKVSDLRHIPLQKKVYDLHVPRYHSYWSNGITSHNTSAARILAAMENCSVSPGGSPCGKCEICKRIFAGTHTDIEEVDAASSAGSVESVRKLKNSALYNPIDGCRVKYFIIDEAHRMSPQANDALLKLLEEPPKNVRFILCTTDVQKLRPAIQSRCQRHDIKKIYWSQIAEHLKHVAKSEKVDADEESINLCARLAQGSMRNGLQNLEKLMSNTDGSKVTIKDAEELFGSVSELAFYDLFDEIVKGEDASPDTSQGFKIINNMLQNGGDEKFEVIYQGLAEYVRNCLVFLTATKAYDYISLSGAAKERLKAQALRIKQSGKLKPLFKSMYSLNQAKESVGLNMPPEIALQTWFVESVIFFRE